MSRIIVMSGHGSWQLGSDHLVTVPANTTIRFYTLNLKTLSDALGGDLDRGVVGGLEADQEGRASTTVPNMRLFPPTGLNIRVPPGDWEVLRLTSDTPLPPRTGNLQIQIDPTLDAGLNLQALFRALSLSLNSVADNLVIWAACRAVNLRESRLGRQVGVNALQR